MKKTCHLPLAIGLAAALALGACSNIGNPYGATTTTPPTTNTAAISGYGVVQSIELVKVDSSGIAGTGLGVGTLAGAVVGGIVGSQVGQGSGKTAATVLGAAGGAYAGHELEKRSQVQQVDAYKFTIRMNDGTYQSVTQASPADLRVGDRVRITNGVAQRY
jgi:outer membrane lipoprotein SlyB